MIEQVIFDVVEILALRAAEGVGTSKAESLSSAFLVDSGFNRSFFAGVDVEVLVEGQHAGVDREGIVRIFEWLRTLPTAKFLFGQCSAPG